MICLSLIFTRRRATMSIFTPTEITDNYMKASVGKAASPAWRLFVLAVAAGLLIGLGGVTSSTAAHGLENAGLVRFDVGPYFPCGSYDGHPHGHRAVHGQCAHDHGSARRQASPGRAFCAIGVSCLRATWWELWLLAACMAFFGQLNIGGGDLAVYTAKVAASKNAPAVGQCLRIGHLLQHHGVHRGVPGQHGPGHRRPASWASSSPLWASCWPASSTAWPICTTCPRVSSRT